jgi:hypothetical protein
MNCESHFLRFGVVAGLCMALVSLSAYAAPLGTTTGDTVVVNGFNVEVDFQEYYAGTFIDDEYATTSGGGGLSVGVPQDFGFTVSYTGTGNNVDAGVIYDTDRRRYNDGDGNTADAPIYDNLVSIIANSEGTGMVGEDPDLDFDSVNTAAPGTFGTNNLGPGSENSWRGGNLSGGPGTSSGTRVGNVIILQEDATTSEINQGHLTLAQGNGVNSDFSTPNAPDDGGAGTIRIDFETGIVAVDFDWVDFEEGGFSITFVDGTATASIDFSEFTGETSNAPSNPLGTGDWVAVFNGVDADQNDGYANNISENSSGNMILTTERVNFLTNTASTQGWSDSQDHFTWDAVIFTLTGSGGLGVVGYTVVPEPSTYVAGALCLLLIGGAYLRRRRRQRSASA